MNLICRLGRESVLLAVLGLGLTVVGCGQPAAPPVKPPVTPPVKPEGGSGMKPDAGGGAEVPPENAPADEKPAPLPEGEKKEGEAN